MVENDTQFEWPQPTGSPDPALAALEEAWRTGQLVENEPT